MFIVYVFCALVLIVLPGCWVSLLTPLPSVSFIMRIALGFILTPLVLYLQFALTRWCGADFEQSAWILVLLNVPPLLLLPRAAIRGGIANYKIEWNEAAPYCVVLVVVLFFFGAGCWSTEARIFGGGHPWIRADAVYSLAAGSFPPEERQIAGLKLAYPWGFYIEQALFSYWLDWSHLSNYLFINHLWILVVAYFAVQLAAEMIPENKSRAVALMLLLLGINLVGFVLIMSVGVAIGARDVHLWGEMRHTPWVTKFSNSTPMVPGIVSTLALLYFLVSDVARRRDLATIFVIFCLLTSTGVIYPLLLPAGCVFVASRVLALLLDKLVFRLSVTWWEVAALGIVMLLAVIVSFSHLNWITQDRTSNEMIGLSSAAGMARKMVQATVVLSVLLAGVAFSFRACWNRHRRATILLLAAAAGCVALNVVFSIPGFRNEYKYFFPAGMALYVFPAYALRPVVQSLGSKALVAIGVATALFSVQCCFSWLEAQNPSRPPQLDPHSFYVRVADPEPWAELLNGIASQAPSDAILVLDKWEFYWPVLTRRSVYVSPKERQFLVGTNVSTDLQLVEAGGYGQELIRYRRSLVNQLYTASEDSARAQSLEEMLSLGRPLLVIANRRDHADLLDWLARVEYGDIFMERVGTVAWLVPSE